MSSRSDTPPALKRDVGLVLFVLYGAGNIIGAGIYVLIGKVAGEAGLHAPVAFVVAAGIAGLSGLSYGELAARHPYSAGEAVYVHRAFGYRGLSVAVGLLIAVAGLVSASTLVRGFVGYFELFVMLPPWLVIAGLVCILTTIAAQGIADSARAAALLTVVEVAGLLWVIAVASPHLASLGALDLDDVLPLSSAAWAGVWAGAFLAFFAFIGFEDMVNIAEEVRDPTRTIPRGIVWAFILSTILYILVALVSVATVAPEVLAASEAPLAEVYQQATGRSVLLIGAIGLVAVVNGALVQIIMAARVLYGMSSNGWLPGFLTAVHPRTQTPVRATLVAGVVTLALALGVPLVGLARTTSAMVLVVFVVIHLSLLRIQRVEPAPEGVRTLPVAVPIAGALGSTFILIVSFWR